MPDIARHFVGIWNDHSLALEEVPLPYLDHLMDAIVANEPLTKWQLQNKLVRMTPRILWGTAGRLVDVKFHKHGRSDILPRVSH
jgi:hypothetical protein